MAGTESITQTHFDVVIVGGGMVGAMLAAGLCHTSLTVAVLEPVQPQPFDPESDPDLRVSAISLAAEQMLRAVDAWQGITSRRCCPYRHLSVEDGENGGKTAFYSGDIGQTHLGHIVENRVLQLALTERIQRSDNVSYLCPARLDSFRTDRGTVTVELSSGDQLRCQLLVGADGGRSQVRQLMGIETDRHSYDQRALVATIKSSRANALHTWQRFVPTGPQAYLPLANGHASIVWYHTDEEIARLEALDDESFVRALTDVFPEQLGPVDGLVGRASFPLVRSHAKHYVKSGVALIGDAAHTVHPLAGQGVNLGLLDAAVLAEILAKAQARTSLNPRGSHGSLGDLRVLRRYERWRRGENAMMIQTLDTLYKSFSPQPEPLRTLRSMALDLADHAGPLKRMVSAYASGTFGDLPLLAQGRLP